jgi:hypothetical protein
VNAETLWRAKQDGHAPKGTVRKGETMESIDVRGLPEEQAQLVAAFVEFLRRQRNTSRIIADAEDVDEGWPEGAAMGFAEDWDNDQDAIYDRWREHYHVSEG